MTNLNINGIEYAPVKPATGTRAVVVVDRGWIFAGDVTRQNGQAQSRSVSSRLAGAPHCGQDCSIWSDVMECFGSRRRMQGSRVWG